MDSYFEEIINQKISSLVAMRLHEPALDGLDSETQLNAKMVILENQLAYELSQLKPTDFVSPAPWMKALSKNKWNTVIAYLTSTPLDDDNSVILTWYEREQKFRLERILRPVASR